MELHNLKATAGARYKNFRKGRGIGSGNGKTSGRGHKGQNARSGGRIRPGHEGGQTVIFRRLPKRGFKNYTQIVYEIVNVGDLERFIDGATINPTVLAEAGLIRSNYQLVKVLGSGTLTKKLIVSAHKFSVTAAEAINANGGRAEVI